jgi:hypothetical protein
VFSTPAVVVSAFEFAELKANLQATAQSYRGCTRFVMSSVRKIRLLPNLRSGAVAKTISGSDSAGENLKHIKEPVVEMVASPSLKAPPSTTLPFGRGTKLSPASKPSGSAANGVSGMDMF